MKKQRFQVATGSEIRRGQTTDIYFDRTVEILRKTRGSRHVKAEFSLKGLPQGYPWGVFAGLEECMTLLEGIDVGVTALEEGTVVRRLEPVMTLEGDYIDFARLETPLLGFICQASGIATKAARLRLAAGDRTLMSFGARRMHPAISPMIERNAYVGGCDGVATVKAGEILGIEPSGTIPHALVILLGGIDDALVAFDECIGRRVKRVALVDTFGDEKFEALAACATLGRGLYAIRLDTPSSRRGNICDIVREVRWELDSHGYSHVRILVSGGLDEMEIMELRDLADGFGVGTCLSSARVLDYAMDIVEVEGEPRAKRGKMSGAKKLLRCTSCHEDAIMPASAERAMQCECGGELENLSRQVMKNGKTVRKPASPKRIRKHVLESLEWLCL
jgi:nicotinate phosphoribosyltransferase